MTEKEKIEYIANIYGLEHQLPILAEECCELAQAALKLNRYPGEPVCKRHLFEELADVEIMVRQLKYLVGEDMVRPYIDMKLDRQIRRIEGDVD